MKKLFVSVPMRGRDEKDIKSDIAKMKQIAEIYAGEEFELIDSYITEEPPADCTNPKIWHLGKAIEKMASADAFVQIDRWYEWPGCSIENSVAKEYNLKTYEVDADGLISNYKELRLGFSKLVAKRVLEDIDLDEDEYDAESGED